MFLSNARQPEVSFISLLMPWRHHICMAKWFYSYRDDLPKGLFKITAEECKKSTSGWRAYFCLRSAVVIRGETNSGVANSSVFSDSICTTKATTTATGQRLNSYSVCICISFSVISLRSLHNCVVKWPNLKFSWERERQDDQFNFVLSY